MSAESRSELLADHSKLFDHLIQHIGGMQRELNDENDFCNQDVDSSIKYIESIEQKFQEKIQQRKKELVRIRNNNKELFQLHKDKLDNESDDIEKLYDAGKYSEALNKFEELQKYCQEREQLNRNMPKLPITLGDVEQLFTRERQLKPAPVQPTKPTVSLPQSLDIGDEVISNSKRDIRAKKVIEADALNDEDKGVDDGKNDQEPEVSTFGIRSRRLEKQPSPLPPSTTNHTLATGNSSSVPSTAPRPPFVFSRRLDPMNKKPDGPLPVRQHRTPPSVLNNNGELQNGHEQRQPTPTRPLASPNQNKQLKPLTINPVVLYTLEDNHHLLMACVARDIVLFKCQRNRLDRWRLDTIERFTSNVRELPWHDGLLISMGFTKTQLLYMFTEHEFLIYSMRPFEKRVARILPHGNDNDRNQSENFYTDLQRGIGTVYDKHMYHIYLNRKSRWTLSKNILQEVVYVHEKDLTVTFPEVYRFIHFCVNEKTISFLVQLEDFSYAVVFCSVHDYTRNNYPSSVILPDAGLPLTICSVLVPSRNQFRFYVNDPSIDVIHVIDTTGYLYYHQVKAHAICHVADKHELMLVTENSICSININ